MGDEFDVIVIGAGPPGENAAGRSADNGLSVAIVEERLAGGECTFYGCIPSKTLIRPGDVLAEARRVPGAAEAITGSIDVGAALAQRDYITSSWDDAGDLRWFDEKGIAFFRGRGRLAGERAVEVSSPDGGTRRLTARRAVVLACGTVPAIPPIEGLREARPWDNRDATAVKEIPRRFLVLGGGPIGLELAQAFRRLGSEQVTVIEGTDRLLPREEPFAGDEVRAALEAEAIQVITGALAVAVRREAPDTPVTVVLEDGRELTGDELLVAVGRRPNTSDVGLDTVGLSELAGRFLDPDDRLRVALPDSGEWLYAVGDVSGLALFTHMGKYQGRIAGDVIAGKDVRDLADHGIVPRVTFTDPQVAAVGLTEQEAREQGIAVRTVSHDTGGVAGAYTRGNGIHGTSFLVVDEVARTIVGATFTGPEVQELVHAATVAIAGKVTLDALWHAVPAFPTMSEVWLRLLEAYGL
ncbi:MAG: NAD(P)/FAD-dependent oxidoreductase [Actinobacteria bacterium]|nr:NAD(P)/FAD-dependent oxidoreductase [Actinomycetota bacterium]